MTLLDQRHRIDPLAPCHACGGSRFWLAHHASGWLCARCIAPFGGGEAWDFAAVRAAVAIAAMVRGVAERSKHAN